MAELEALVNMAAKRGCYTVNKPFGHKMLRKDTLLIERVKQELRQKGYSVTSDEWNLNIKWESAVN